MSRTRRTRGLSIQEPEDNAVGVGSPLSITVSVPTLNQPRGRPRRNPLRSQTKRADLAHEASDRTNISTSKPIITIPSSSKRRTSRSPARTGHTATKKQKRTLSGDARRTCLQTACGGCSRKSHPHAENWEQDLVAICHKCNKEWHSQCMAREGIQRVGASSQWECRDCSRLLPAYTDGIDAEATPERQARDTTIVMEELDTPRITDDYRGLVSFSKTAVLQAQDVYEEARGLLNTVHTERNTCRERLSKLKREIEHCGDGLEEYRRHFDSDDVRPGDGESEHSISHQLALGVCGDPDWIRKVTDKIDLIRAEDIELTRRLKSIQDDVEIKLAKLKRVEQQHSEVSHCLRTSCKVFKRLRLKVTMGFIEDCGEDSDSVFESTMEDSVAGDIPPNRIAREIERQGEANQQRMMENSKSNDERGQMRALSQLTETAEESESISTEEFDPPQISLQSSRIVVLQNTPATEVAESSGIASVSEPLEKTDTGEIQAFSQPLEMDRVREQPGPFMTVEAVEGPQELPQMPGPVKAPKQSDTAGGTGLQETTVHISSPDLGEGCSQRQNVSLAAGISGERDRSCTPENSRRTQDPHRLPFVSVPAALPPSPDVLDQLESLERSGISLVPEDISVITGGRSSEDPHSHRLVGGMALSAENHHFPADVINRRPEHLPPMPAEADLASVGAGYENIFRSKPPPPVLGPGCLQSLAKHNDIVLPPITRFSPLRDALQYSVLQSPSPSWSPSSSFKQRISRFLNKQDNEEMRTRAGVIYRRDLSTLVPDLGCFLRDVIINKYLQCLTQHTNGRIAMIGTMDSIRPDHLESLAAFAAIYIPIKLKDSHWTLAVLYPGPLRQQGRSEVYDSHNQWATETMTTSNVFNLLKYRLGDAYSPMDWAVSQQRHSQPQQRDADSALYVLANAKSIALNLGMIRLDTHRIRTRLRWQFAKELLTESIVEAF
ncbi:hypothetical protein V502_00604 [Pseudogymnoascus sp. VKM F-4520 (FW-2644)]|nr:hypothetical protein V502_00604 [Pseudogymnoascus sp. VKM F-4520 (FW-2644)]